MTYTEIQNEIIKKYNVDICDGTKCANDWSRTHSHPAIRRVCKWKQCSSINSTFTLLHEVGHLETHTSRLRRCESEYLATAWAIERIKEYGIADKITDNIKRRYQNYIYQERDRGVRRGGMNYPTEEQLKLEW